MDKVTFEVCAGSYQDCLAAWKGGADRVELNSALSVGGLTPSLVSLMRVKRELTLPVICMVRPRAGGFCYDRTETELMLEEAELLLGHGADGIAFGFLNADKTIEWKKTEAMAELIHKRGGEAVFHRAFDVTPDPEQAIEILIECGADRILTSGQKAKAPDGAELIQRLQEKYGAQVEILAGSGINETNVKKLIAETGIRQVHSSCKAWQMDPTTFSEEVSYAYLPKPHEAEYDYVDAERVKKLRTQIYE